MSLNITDDNLLVTFIASILIWVMAGGLLGLFLINKRIPRRQIALAIISGILAWVIALIVKDLIPEVRPFSLNGYRPLTITIPRDASFPSGHTALAFGVAVYLWLRDKKLGFIYLTAAFFVGLGRILSLVHYPIDVVGGIILGTFSALVIDSLHHKGVKYSDIFKVH